MATLAEEIVKDTPLTKDGWRQGQGRGKEFRIAIAGAERLQVS